jgi:predicted AlkP superfamily phosphohydrolase/phosphomutase/tetratricopeptide (TPR) repeat protein
MTSQRLTKKVLLIGWDAADWKVIHPLIEQGKMPALEQFITAGVMGNLATLDPPLSPIMWTSIGTGKTADKHGVLGFTQPRADGKGIQPVLATTRKVKAVWNILMQAGFKTHVVGWWPSHPAEPLNGVCISDFYHKANAPQDNWQMAPGTVYPERLAETLAELRVHPEELTAQHILPFVPAAEKVDQEKDQRLWSVAKITAECSSIQAAATWVMEHEPWDFMAVYFDSIDHYCHGFMKFHPPYRDGLPRELYDLYHEVVESGYRFHDMMLSRLLQLAGEETTVIICSDHGFHPDHLRPLHLPNEPAGPAAEHSPYGIVAIKGPGIRRDELIYGSTLLDITPTILSLFGLPVGRDMDGKPLVQAFTKAIEPAVIDSWETVAGECGMHPVGEVGDPWADQEALNQLVALGYIEANPDEEVQKTVEKTVRESKYYLARVYLHKHDYYHALPLLEELYSKSPDQTRFGLRLAHCYQTVERLTEARRVTDEVIAAWKHQRIEKAREAKEKAEKEGKDTSQMSIPTDPHNPSLDLLQGNLYLAEDKPEEALTYFQRAQQASPRLPHIHLNIGQTYLKLQRLTDAEEAFFQALDIDPDSAAAYHGLAQVYLQKKHFQEAAEAAMSSVGLIYHNPVAHYHLGEALFRLGKFELAAQSWEVCVSQAPGMKKAHDRLVKLYQHYLPDAVKMTQHQEIIQRIQPLPKQQPVVEEEQEKTNELLVSRVIALPVAKSEIITVVSGLPRSGTSLMMQLLQAGGMTLLTDSWRTADENNPKGYFEYEPVKRLHQDNSWLGEAKGKVLKVIAPMLPSLSPACYYRIVFMQRDLEEVLQSQATMLAREEHSGGNPTWLKQSYQQQLKRITHWIAQQHNLSVLYVSHHDLLNHPQAEVERLNAFLEGELELGQCVKVVDKQLYRSRKAVDSG